MSENTQVKKSSSKVVIILLIVLILLVAGGIVTGVVIMLDRGEGASLPEGGEPAITVGYEQNGVVAFDEDELQKWMEEAVQQAQEGMMDLSYKNVAVSKDGVHFSCSLGNPITNRYDMFLNIYFNHDLEQQMLLTGLIPPGTKIESFVSEIPIPPGEYEATLVFTQLEDDHATLCGQSMVVLNIIVTNGEDENQSGE